MFFRGRRQRNRDRRLRGLPDCPNYPGTPETRLHLNRRDRPSRGRGFGRFFRFGRGRRVE